MQNIIKLKRKIKF
nr:unnamed protein product [Callosobruchus analis]CAI5826532.1 unnamed protein product [Callosobruchus analis]CAI5840090.1 unnamed protein product [Callosobruchus analis]CAI5843854.1 unnamed protein product [Callosobruchus analis]CAI5865052.1 unnamed protein product [Callosobruchus analis]